MQLQFWHSQVHARGKYCLWESEQILIVQFYQRYQNSFLNFLEEHQRFRSENLFLVIVGLDLCFSYFVFEMRSRYPAAEAGAVDFCGEVSDLLFLIAGLWGNPYLYLDLLVILHLLVFLNRSWSLRPFCHSTRFSMSLELKRHWGLNMV